MKSKARRGQTAPGFSLRRTRGTPKTPWFLGPHAPGDPKRKRFLSAAFPHPKPQNQQRSALEKSRCAATPHPDVFWWDDEEDKRDNVRLRRSA